MSWNFFVKLEANGEWVKFERRQMADPFEVYTDSNYPDYIDSEIVKKYRKGDGEQNIYNVLLLLGAFPWVFKNFQGFILPARGDGSCFYNAFATYLEIYGDDITQYFNTACSGIMRSTHRPTVFNCYRDWYRCDNLSTSMKLRMIAAWYILQNAYNYSHIYGDIDAYVCENILQPGSLADEPVIVALHNVLRTNIHIISPNEESGYDRTYTIENHKGVIALFHKGNAHYDLILSQRQVACIAAMKYGHGKLEKYSEKIFRYFNGTNRSPDLVKEFCGKFVFPKFM